VLPRRLAAVDRRVTSPFPGPVARLSPAVGRSIVTWQFRPARPAR